MSNNGAAPSGGTLGPSLVRTGVPFLAGLLGTWLLSTFGVAVDSQTSAVLVSAVIGYLYYVAVRFLEIYGSDRWGYILGFRKQPTYVPPGEAVVVEAQPDNGLPRDDTGAADLYLVGVVLTVAGFVALIVSAIAGSGLSVALSAVLIVVGVLLVAVGPKLFAARRRL